MRLPSLYALTYQELIESVIRSPVMAFRHLDFEPPDMGKFPCLGLADEAAEAGGAKPVALNAADEIADAAFLDGSIRFNEIPAIIKMVLGETKAVKLESINKVLLADAEARRMAREKVEQLGYAAPSPSASSILRGE